MHTELNSRFFSLASYFILVAVAAAAAYLFLDNRLLAAAGGAGFVLLALVFISQRDTLPAVFTFLFVAAGLINAAGYLFNLWKTPIWFDEAVHFYTGFTVMAAIGWLAFSQTKTNAAGRELRFTASVAGLGLLIGALWEAFEWIIGIIGTPRDTVIDLIMDTLGAIAAGLFCAWAASRERKAVAGAS